MIVGRREVLGPFDNGFRMILEYGIRELRFSLPETGILKFDVQQNNVRIAVTCRSGSCGGLRSWQCGWIFGGRTFRNQEIRSWNFESLKIRNPILRTWIFQWNLDFAMCNRFLIWLLVA